MPDTIISVENLTKRYELGVINTGTFSRDLNKWWARLRGKPDPYMKIGQKDHGNRQGDSILALDDVSFTVERGEALGIIGQNGAGKSTLLKILSQVTKQTSGRVRIKGRIGSLLEVGTGFHPELTGRENVYLNGAILGMRKDEVDRKFDEIVDFSGVEQFIDTPVKRYSSGMYVRLAFAVAAHLEPEILVVDEVLAVGDAEFQKKCLGKMGDVASGGRTVLFVSHNMAAVETLCQKCLFLSTGKLVDEGAPKKVINLYLSKANQNKPKTKIFNGLIKQVQLINSDGDVSQSIFTGEPLIFRITIETKDSHIENPVIGLGINNTYGSRIFTVGTYFSSCSLSKIVGREIVECMIDENPLVPGSYFLKVALGKSFSENVEEIDNAIKFNVEPSDFFGNGKLPNSKQGVVLVKSDWKVINE